MCKYLPIFTKHYGSTEFFTAQHLSFEDIRTSVINLLHTVELFVDSRSHTIVLSYTNTVTSNIIQLTLCGERKDKGQQKLSARPHLKDSARHSSRAGKL